MVNAAMSEGAILAAMRGFGFLLLALLALVLAPAAESLRAPAKAAFWTELCADGVTQQVAVAADGSPVLPGDTPDAPRHCPDCLPLAQPVTAGGAATLPRRLASLPRRLSAMSPPSLPAGLDRPRGFARGPPRVI